MSEQFLMIDFPALIIVSLASMLCAILGSFLVLKKQAVMVDAISHSVLPGIVTGVVLSGSFSIFYVMSGAMIASLVSVAFVHILQYWGGVERGAAIGTSFTTMFAVGVLLLETQVGSNIHLDTQHVLYGALELTYWETPFDWQSMPQQIKTLSALLIIVLLLLTIFFKEAKLTTFDQEYAAIIGYQPRIFHFTILILTALVAVACFEATGSILVIALFVCPAATARMITDTLPHQFLLSTLIALFCAITGYICSAFMPTWLGFNHAVNSAAVIAIVLGLFLMVSIVFSSKHGILVK